MAIPRWNILLWAGIRAASLFDSAVAQDVSEFRTACLSFDPKKHVANIPSVNAHEFVSAGTTLQLPDNDPSCARPNQTVSIDVCRIALNISTSSRSGIIFEQWLPVNWAGRFLATGNGGIDGCLKYEDVNYGAANGFSSVGSNNGHNGTGGEAFYLNSEVVEDYVWRSCVPYCSTRTRTRV